MELDLLRKSELKFIGVDLDGANLNDLAAAVAEVLELEREEVFVTDYLDRVLTFDILREKMYSHQLLGKRDALFARMRAIKGVTLGEDTRIYSEGMLGWIAADAADVGPAFAEAERMAAVVKDKWSKRCMIFATGAEVKDGQVKDTNSTTIAETLEAAGFTSSFGGTLSDDMDLIAGSILRAVDNGFGLVFTTGGVGAESKDCTVEAVLTLDAQAATPYICTFEVGKGRHVKPGVRIAVGEVDGARIVSLPGPNDEVCAAMPIVLAGLAEGAANAVLAERVAVVLREKWRQKLHHHGHHHH